MKRLRVNTLKDHCNFLFHFGLTAGVATAAVVALGCPPILGAIAVTATAGIHFALNPKVGRAFQEAIDEEKKSRVSERAVVDFDALLRDHRRNVRIRLEDYIRPPVPRFNPRIQDWVEGFAQKLGMQETPNLLVMDNTSEGSPHGNKGLKGALREFLRTQFNQTANAFAFRHTYGNVVLTGPIVEELNARELKGVVGHEMGHLAAHHTTKRQTMAMLSTPAKILTSLNYLVTAYSSWRTAGLSLAASAAGAIAAGFVAKKLGWSEEDKADKPKIQNLRSAFSSAAVMGAGIAFAAPDLALAAGINYAVNNTLTLIGKRYSRRIEFQADRIAADLTGDPQGLGRGLEKIMELHKRKLHGNDNSPDKDKKLTGVFGRLNDLGETHPNTERRCARLAQMDQRAEYIYA